MNIAAWFTDEVIAILWAVFQSVVILLGVVMVSALLVMVERRVLALWQGRHGPNRVGPFGLLQLVADMLKMMFKEDWSPPFVDKLTFWLAPAIGLGCLIIAFAVVPITPTWGVADLDNGLLIFLAMAGLAVYAVMFAGWSSNNKYALLGGLRSAAQTVTYEVFMGLSVMGVAALTGSFSVRDIVLAQADGWYIVPQFIGFITFIIAGVAVAHRTPFDLPEAEQELAAGYHTEYSGLKFGMFMIAEYVGVVLVSAMLTVLFCGGWLPPATLVALGEHVPVLGSLLAMIPAFFWFAGKMIVFIVFFILLRAALPRPRYDHMMGAGWKVLLPLTLVNLLATGAYILLTNPAV